MRRRFSDEPLCDHCALCAIIAQQRSPGRETRMDIAKADYIEGMARGMVGCTGGVALYLLR